MSQEKNASDNFKSDIFFTRVQGQTKSIDAYATDLKNDFEFQQFTESLIRDRIVCEITNDQVRGRLLRNTENEQPHTYF